MSKPGTVININRMNAEQLAALRSGDPLYVWVGSDHPILHQKKSKWANPNQIATIIKECKGRKCSIQEAAEIANERYKEALQANPKLMRALPELRGKILVCSCKPLCPHDWLLSLVEALP
jgi:hypothetical protein